MSLKLTITDDMKNAMRAKDTAKLGTIRLLLAAMKQREVDERIELSDEQIVAIIDKMQKQRRDSISQYEAAGRQDLADIEKAEMLVLEGYMPQQADEAEIATLLDAAFAAHGSNVAAMGKIMADLKPKLAGRADMSKVSALVKARIQ
ncbi:GatB/YqeY domain-containing protein [Chitinimonas arctica]|uniref:GatB/YqeY domain-containing protein n=1 Tax=Chitinimonas arctica TaxID=2594795 RepID=A0A516SJM4_9NEIS|nr:GatB/YqeY domain-containing protein [Chitinimonas arctica]QDQ28347.1 GatB/YqeY domain-containing protein [Chitinimonas arctica]